MAGHLHRLTARTVQGALSPGRYADGGNLYLMVSPSGARSWLFIYRAGGRQREMGLGSATSGAVSLADARQRAAQARKLLSEGRDPLEVRKDAERSVLALGTTFGSFADDYVETHRSGWKSEEHAGQWAMTLGERYCAALRTRPIAQINIDDVLGVLQPIWLSVPETARRIRMRIEKILDAAKVKGLRSGDNPARWRGNLDHLLPRQPKSGKRHHAAVPFAEVPGVLARLRELSSVSARALEFAVLTAARTNEVLAATWGEFDLQTKTWTVPANRMKAGREHRVPLSDAALSILKQQQDLSDTLVFPGLYPDQPLSDMALLMCLRGLNRNETVHGFRSSFRDWAAEKTDFPSEVVEMALAHRVANATEAAYRRGDLFEKRRKLMQAWEAYCYSPQSKALSIKDYS